MQTLRSQVLNAIRDMILQRKLPPGERLVERALCEELGVSRTPVRECYPVLEMEGLVENFPGLGVVVRSITLREVKEALEVRDALDAFAVSRAATQRTDEDLVHLEAALRLNELAVSAGDEARISATDGDFHAKIYQAAHNSVLISVRDAFALYEGFYFHPDFYRYTKEAFARSLRRHREMFGAIKEQNPEAAEKASRQHIQEAVKLLHEDKGDVISKVKRGKDA